MSPTITKKKTFARVKTSQMALFSSFSVFFFKKKKALGHNP